VESLQKKIIKEEKNLKVEKEKNADLQRQLVVEKDRLINNQKELEKTQTCLLSYQQFVNNLLKNKNDELEELSNQARKKLGESEE